MKHDAAFWARLSPPERSELVRLERDLVHIRRLLRIVTDAKAAAGLSIDKAVANIQRNALIAKGEGDA